MVWNLHGMMARGDTAAALGEQQRLSVLAAYDVLDTPAEQDFDDLAHLAAELCETPVALISFVASDRQWFKARVGFSRCETGLESSVCRYAPTEPDILVIPDLEQDPRTVARAFFARVESLGIPMAGVI